MLSQLFWFTYLYYPYLFYSGYSSVFIWIFCLKYHNIVQITLIISNCCVMTLQFNCILMFKLRFLLKNEIIWFLKDTEMWVQWNLSWETAPSATQMWSQKTGGLSRQVLFKGLLNQVVLRMWSLKTGGLSRQSSLKTGSTVYHYKKLDTQDCISEDK